MLYTRWLLVLANVVQESGMAILSLQQYVICDFVAGPVIWRLL